NQRNIYAWNHGRSSRRQHDGRRAKGDAVWLHRQVNPDSGEGGEHGHLAPDQGELPRWAHGGLLERMGGRQRCLSLHRSVYLSRRSLATQADVLEGLVEPTESELVAVAACLLRLGTAAIQEEMCLFAKHQLER